MLPLAMLGGGIFYSFFNLFAFLTPYLISVMLLITCCRLSIREMRFTRLHAWMLMVQVFGSVIVYGVLCYFDRVLAEAMMICVLAPTAVAAAVITGMLGGSVPCLATYTLASNLCVAIVAPVMFSLVGVRDGVSFGLVYLHSGGTFVAFTSCRGLGVGVFCSFRAQNIACPPEYFVLPVEFESDDRDGENGVFYHAAG